MLKLSKFLLMLVKLRIRCESHVLRGIASGLESYKCQDFFSLEFYGVFHPLQCPRHIFFRRWCVCCVHLYFLSLVGFSNFKQIGTSTKRTCVRPKYYSSSIKWLN